MWDTYSSSGAWVDFCNGCRGIVEHRNSKSGPSPRVISSPSREGRPTMAGLLSLDLAFGSTAHAARDRSDKCATLKAKSTSATKR